MKMNNISLSRAERGIIIAFGVAAQSRTEIDERTIQFCDRNHDAMQSLVSKNILTSTLAEHARLTKFGEMAFIRIRATERIQALINASRAKIIAIAVFLCLSANGVFAQQAPDFFNRAERLEDVPGLRKTDIREIIPVRDFMSVEQYELTLPSRARARGFTLLAKQAAQGDYSPKGQPTTIREELRLPCGRIIILYKEYDAIPPSKSNQ